MGSSHAGASACISPRAARPPAAKRRMRTNDNASAPAETASSKPATSGCMPYSLPCASPSKPAVSVTLIANQKRCVRPPSDHNRKPRHSPGAAEERRERPRFLQNVRRQKLHHRTHSRERRKTSSHVTNRRGDRPTRCLILGSYRGRETLSRWLSSLWILSECLPLDSAARESTRDGARGNVSCILLASTQVMSGY